MAAIGVLEIEIFIPSSTSLKEKRYILRGLKDRVKKLNVSISEIDGHDLWQRAKFLVAVASIDNATANSILSKVMGIFERERRIFVLDYSMRFL